MRSHQLVKIKHASSRLSSKPIMQAVETIVFAVVQGVRLLHVVPRKVAVLSVSLKPVKPVLDTLITDEPKGRARFALLEEVCQKISIGTNTSPTKYFHR